MSRVANVTLLVDPADDYNVERLSFWMASADAVQDGADVKVGSLLSLTAGASEQRWGGYKALSFSAWGSVTNYLNWEAFFDQLRTTEWEDPARVQLLMMEDGDSYFRLYMLRDGDLVNVVPEPADGGFDRPW